MPAEVIAPVTETSFASYFTQPTDNGTISIKADSAKHAKYIGDLIASQQRISQIGEQPVTIINLNPYPLRVLGCLFDGMDIKANKEGDQYFAYVVRRVKYEVDTGTDHNHRPVEFWPIQLAMEFERQYAEKGGVFIIKGNLEQHPELVNTREFKEKFKAADAQLVIYATQMKRIGDNEWNSPNHANARNIHATHRICATLLFRRRLIAKLPDWMNDDVIDVESLPTACPTCGTDPKKGAVICGPCGMILDPYEAYKRQIITESHNALERLTRKQVEDLGISGYVAETIDEKPKRIKAGSPKPIALFERQQMDARAKEEAAARAKAN